MPTAYFFRTNSRTCQSFLFGLIWLVIEFRSKRNYNQLREGTSNFNSQKLSTEKKYFDILDKTSQKFSNFVLNLLRVGWYSSPCLAPCLTIHPLSAAVQNCQIAREDILHRDPTSQGLQSIQSIQPANSSEAKWYNLSQKTWQSTATHSNLPWFLSQQFHASKLSTSNVEVLCQAPNLPHYTSNALFQLPASSFTGSKKNARLKGESAQTIRGHNISTPLV